MRDGPEGIDYDAQARGPPGRLASGRQGRRGAGHAENRAMAERLVIDNFAGLKHVDIELRKINIFVGPQATGKSVAAKLAYFFKSLSAEIVAAAIEAPKRMDFSSRQVARFRNYFPPETCDGRRFAVRYECARESAEVKSTGKEQTERSQAYAASAFYDEAVRQAAEAVRQGSKLGPYIAALGAIAHLVQNGAFPPSLFFDQLFIPAERAFYANVRSAVFSIMSAQAVLDPFLIAFGSTYEGIKKVYLDHQHGEGEMWRISREILGATYLQEDGEEYLALPDGRRVDVGHSSSGQQAALPICVLPAAWLLGHLMMGRTFWIEEPEAHVFPTTQRLIVELMAEVFNAQLHNEPVQYGITTHSPYILTAFNNLIQAGKLAEELAGDAAALKKLHEIVPESRIISPKDVAAYYFDNGTARPIMDEETGLILAEEIDNVSEEIAIQFDKLLDIERH